MYTFIEKELPNYVMRKPGYERNYCEIRALVDNHELLELNKVTTMTRSINGTPLILGCIQNEPAGVPDYTQPWPLKGLIEDIINKNE